MTKDEAKVKAKELRAKIQFEFFRHFKGNVYYVTEVSVHSETNDILVTYRTVDVKEGNLFIVMPESWSRPADMFMSEVDHEKYPEVSQKMRFEKIDDWDISSFNYYDN